MYSGSNSLQLDKINTYFTESHTGKFVPRSFFVDLDPAAIDGVLNGKYSNFFHEDKTISGVQGGSNNYAKGHHTDGAELVCPTLEMIRKDVEICDCLQGFQITHSLGGGCGSGLGALLMMKLLEEYTDRITAAYSIFPSPKVKLAHFLSFRISCYGF